jgi:hypothetical protein
MQEPSPRTSRLAIAASLVAALAIGAGGFLLGRQATPPPPEAVPARPAPAPTPVAPQETIAHVLDRAQVLALANAASDAAASDQAEPELLTQAPGQRFKMYVPFGCDGPAEEGSQAALRWTYSAEQETLRVHVAPQTWEPAQWWSPPPPGLRGLQGFWIPRPWSTRETCAIRAASRPTLAADRVVPDEPEPTLGLAEVITDASPRQRRRAGKPYLSVTRLAPDAAKLASGLRLRLQGRIDRFPEGGAARCIQPGGDEHRPSCLIAVTLDEVAIENPATGEALAVWAPTAGNSAPGAEP